MQEDLRRLIYPGGLDLDFTQTIELNVPTNTNQLIDFGQNANYKNIEDGWVYGINSFSVASITKSLLGYNVINATAYKQSYLRVGFNNSDIKHRDFPLPVLDFDSNGKFPLYLKPFKITFSNCQIYIPDPSTIGAGESYLFQFLYTKDNPYKAEGGSRD